MEVANTIGIITKREFETMLEFFHDLGVILYYGGSGSLDSLLCNTIILKPQWLVDMFKRIVTAKPPNDKVVKSHKILFFNKETYVSFCSI